MTPAHAVAAQAELDKLECPDLRAALASGVEVTIGPQVEIEAGQAGLSLEWRSGVFVVRHRGLNLLRIYPTWQALSEAITVGYSCSALRTPT